MVQVIKNFQVIVSAVLLLALYGCGGKRQVLTEGQHGFSGQSKPPVSKGKSKEKVPQINSFPICFVKLSGEELKYVEVLRDYRGPFTSTDYIDFVANELMKGPNGDEAACGLSTEVPKGAVVISVQDRGKEQILNLSRSFVMGGGMESFDIRMEQLRRTLAAAGKGHKVYLNIEGERLTRTVGEGLEVQQPICN